LFRDACLIYRAGYSANNRDVYLEFLGNYCKLRNPEGTDPKRGKCQALLGMGNGTMSTEGPLAQLAACLWIQFYLCSELYSHPQLPPSSCLPAFLPTYTWCMTFGKPCLPSGPQAFFIIYKSIIGS
jgi:hypothetical protein